MPTAVAHYGLTTEQARERRLVDGPNDVPRPRPRRLIARIGAQLRDPLVLLLIASAAVTGALRDLPDTSVIALVIVVNTVIGVTQEVRADRAIAALDRLSAPTARVMRDGHERVLPAVDLVRGDVVAVQSGDIVPADITVTDAQMLRVDEAALTGESVPVDHDRGDDLSAGTVVVTGRAVGVVARIGLDSALGRISALVAGARPVATPLQKRLVRLGRQLGAAIVLLSALVAGLGMLAGRGLIDMAITGVSLVVAAVPESLPAVVTVALALGARRMASRHAVPRRLHAVETLGSVTVFASDKTGTLTEGRMAVLAAMTADGTRYSVSGLGYEPTGQVHFDGMAVAAPQDLVELARAAALCNDALLFAPTSDQADWSVAGDPMEGALLAFGARCGLDLAAERRRHPRLGEHPFDPLTRRMATVHEHPAGPWLICKGAPETLLAPGVTDLPAPHRRAFAAEAQRMARAGQRVIAVAVSVGQSVPVDLSSPTALRLLGLVAVADPVRTDAPPTIAALQAAGVRVLLVTGDHPATAAAIGAAVGIQPPTAPGAPAAPGGDGSAGRPTAAPPPIASAVAPPAGRVAGVDTPPAGRVAGVDTLPIDRVAGVTTPPGRVAGIADGADAAANGHIYARVRPEQKLQLVSELQAAGEVVAMTGDGVNDAPALRRADIGVAMGGGTEVARQAADLVLTDDGLGTILVAVREGRRIYQNIRRFLWYALAGGTAEILVMLLGPFVGLAIPLLPAQILWINLLTHGLPGVALGAEPATPGLMRRPPRSPAESVLGNGLATVIGLTGSLIGAVTLISGLVAHARGWPWQSVLFLTLGLAQLGVALAVRARRTATEPANNALWLAVAVSAVLQVAGVLVAPLRELLGTEWLTGSQLLACVAVAAVPGAVLMVWRHRRLHRRLDLDRDRDLPSEADRDLTDDAGPQPASGPAEGSKVPAVPSARPCPVAADPYQAGTRTKGDPT